jgi:ubiquinone/menaquinone biosynthesis C-methylase UbiE
MGIYREHLFPRLMDWVMSGQVFDDLRRELLKEARGDVLEIGFGTGLNLAHYPAATVSQLWMVDPARFLSSTVQARVARVDFPVQIAQLTAEALPFPAQRFDCIVSTWTLCTVPDPLKALREASRVLKPDGVFLFLEHGRSRDARIAAWQERLNPLQNLLGCGCNLTRRIDELVERSGFRFADLKRFQMPHVPRIAAEMYQGRARRTGAADHTYDLPFKSIDRRSTDAKLAE